MDREISRGTMRADRNTVERERESGGPFHFKPVKEEEEEEEGPSRRSFSSIKDERFIN